MAKYAGDVGGVQVVVDLPEDSTDEQISQAIQAKHAQDTAPKDAAAQQVGIGLAADLAQSPYVGYGAAAAIGAGAVSAGGWAMSKLQNSQKVAAAESSIRAVSLDVGIDPEPNIARFRHLIEGGIDVNHAMEVVYKGVEPRNKAIAEQVIGSNELRAEIAEISMNPNLSPEQKEYQIKVAQFKRDPYIQERARDPFPQPPGGGAGPSAPGSPGAGPIPPPPEAPISAGPRPSGPSGPPPASPGVAPASVAPVPPPAPIEPIGTVQVMAPPPEIQQQARPPIPASVAPPIEAPGANVIQQLMPHASGSVGDGVYTLNKEGRQIAKNLGVELSNQNFFDSKPYLQGTTAAVPPPIDEFTAIDLRNQGINPDEFNKSIQDLPERVQPYSETGTKASAKSAPGKYHSDAELAYYDDRTDRTLAERTKWAEKTNMMEEDLLPGEKRPDKKISKQTMDEAGSLRSKIHDWQSPTFAPHRELATEIEAKAADNYWRARNNRPTRYDHNDLVAEFEAVKKQISPQDEEMRNKFGQYIKEKRALEADFEKAGLSREQFIEQNKGRVAAYENLKNDAEKWAYQNVEIGEPEVQAKQPTKASAPKQTAQGIVPAPGLAVQEFPIDQLKLSKDVPQFKSGAGEGGIVEPLGGKFERTGVAPVQVWKREGDGYEIISGRHRFDLAQRSGETTIPVQIHDEAAGFDIKQAKRLDAELNIREGQGKLIDYVDTLANISPEEAQKQGLTARGLGKNAMTVAQDGTPTLIGNLRNGYISDSVAVDIAKSFPKNEAVQNLVLDQIISKGATPATAIDMGKALQVNQRAAGGENADMFGFDDSMAQEAERMAKAVNKEKALIQERLSAMTGAAKNPKLAAQEGIDVKDEAAVNKRIAQLKNEKERWANWQNDPELVAKLRSGGVGANPNQGTLLGGFAGAIPAPKGFSFGGAIKKAPEVAMKGLGALGILDMALGGISLPSELDTVRDKSAPTGTRSKQEMKDEFRKYGKALNPKNWESSDDAKALMKWLRTPGRSALPSSGGDWMSP